MKIILVAGILVVMAPTLAAAQDITLGRIMPAATPHHLVRYRYTYTKVAAEAGQDEKTSPYSGSVDVSVDDGVLYYREFRGDHPYMEVLYKPREHRVLLFNHPQNRLNVFDALPYEAARFIPFPFQDEELSRVVQLATAKDVAVPPGKTQVSHAGTLGQSGHATVPVQFRATLADTPAGPRVNTFAVQSPDGNVADWTFTYGAGAKEGGLPTSITRTISLPIMTREEQQEFLQHKDVPLDHWRPDARIQYTLVEDRVALAGDVPSEAGVLKSANEQTKIVDRRDLKNPISVAYRQDGGDLEQQIQAARAHGLSASGSEQSGGLVRVGAAVVLASVVLGAGWFFRRRIGRTAKA